VLQAHSHAHGKKRCSIAPLTAPLTPMCCPLVPLPVLLCCAVLCCAVLCCAVLCCAVQNLREAIATYRGRLMAETKESRRATLMAVCIEYLER
jgi:hypothetical protein